MSVIAKFKDLRFGAQPDDQPSADSVDFKFDVDPSVAKWSRLAFVRPETCSFKLQNGRMKVHFGFWTLDTPIANIKSARITGPYKKWRIAGPARGGSDKSVTFATSCGPGVEMEFFEPVKALDPIGLVRHPSFTVTVMDPHALLNALGFAGDNSD